MRLTGERRVADEGEVVRPSFTPSADRRSLLDRAHRGDVVGALGRVPAVDTGPRRSSRRRAVRSWRSWGLA